MFPPEEPEGPPALSAGLAVGLTIAAALGQGLLLVLLVTLSGYGTSSHVGIATLVAYGGALAFAVPRIPPPPGRSLGLVPAPVLAWTAAGLLLPSVLLESELDNLARALAPPPEALQPSTDLEQWGGVQIVEALLVAAVVLPAVEELFFRGLLQPRLVELLGRGRGVVAAATLNGLAALLLGPNPWAFPPALGRGLVLGALRDCSGSVLPGLGLNALFGVTQVLAAQRAFGIPGFDELGPHTPLGWLVPAALFTGVGLRICQVVSRQRAGS